MDIVAPDAPLDEYKLVEAPALNLLPEAVAQHLIEYVNHGGNLVLGPPRACHERQLQRALSWRSARTVHRAAGRPRGGILRSWKNKFPSMER